MVQDEARIPALKGLLKTSFVKKSIKGVQKNPDPQATLNHQEEEKKEGIEAFDDEFFEFDQDLCDCVLQSSLLDCD